MSEPETDKQTAEETPVDHDVIREQNKKRSKRYRRITGFLYYAFLIAVIAGVYMYSRGDSTGPISFAGLTPQIVLTRSMQDEIPQDSLVISMRTDAAKIAIGDDITYLKSQDTTVTHRVVQIYEDYFEGQRGFMTQGTMNPSPDRDVVPAVNIVGKVVFHSLFLGRVVIFVRDNFLFILPMIVLLYIFAIFLRRFLKKNSNKENSEDKEENISNNDSESSDDT